MWKNIISTDNQFTGLILRFTLFIMMFPMGYMKVSAFGATLEALQNFYGLPSFIAVLVILIEFIVPLLLLFGVGSRIGAVLLFIIMLGATFYHVEHGFYMNWFGNQKGEGYQFHLLAMGTCLALMVSGGGKLSTDGILQQKWLSKAEKN